MNVKAVTAAALLGAAVLYAAELPGKKGFISANLPAGSTLTKAKVAMDGAKKKTLQEAWGVDAGDTEYEFIVGRDADKKISVAVYFTTRYVTTYKSVHCIGVALNPDGTIKEVAVLQGSDEWGQKMGRKSFLRQFTGKPAAPLKPFKDILAVTGATYSSEEMVAVANTAMGVYASFIKE